MQKIIFRVREVFGYHLVINVPGDMIRDERTKKIVENIINMFPSWPTTFLDHSDRIQITYP